MFRCLTKGFAQLGRAQQTYTHMHTSNSPVAHVFLLYRPPLFMED